MRGIRDIQDRDYNQELIVTAAQNIKERDYWLQKLGGEVEKSSIAADNPIDDVNEKTYSFAKFTFPAKISSTLNRLSSESEFTIYVYLLAGLAVLLKKYTGNSDIIVGAPIFKQEVTGDFINTVLALRIRVESRMTFKELLLQVKQTLIEAVENQNYPLEILVKKLKLPIPGNNFPLFDTAILLENIHDKSYLQHLHLNMIFSFLKENKNIKGNLEYHTGFYRQETIERVIRHFTNLLQELFYNLDVEAAAVDILSEDEKNKLLADFNDTASDNPTDLLLHRLFEKQVLETPDSTAITNEGKQITYKELNERSNQLARVMREKSVREGTIVGVMLEPSLEIMIGIMGILKAGAAYLPIDPDFPFSRIDYMLKDSQASILLTDSTAINTHPFSLLQNLHSIHAPSYLTVPRPQITDLDAIPIPDRSLVDYEKYSRYIGQAMTKNTYISLLASRGCPFKCAYCHKIWPKKHILRSAENIFQEVRLYYNMGVRRFVITDDVFNLNIKNSMRFYQLIIENKLDVQLFFTNGLRGDLLTKRYIDMMIKAGTVNIALALETASPRLQRLIGKNLILENFKENTEYLCEKYPNVILEIFMMHGFPTESEEEALKTLDFVKRLKWAHFAYFNIVRIYSHTDMEKLALECGISRESIVKSENLAFHEFPDTLPFSRDFTLKHRTDFLSEYILSKERLLQVLPYQMKILTREEIVQKYDTFFPVEITSFDGLLKFLEIREEELKTDGFLDEDHMSVPGINQKLERYSTRKEPEENALKILLLDLSQLFSHDTDMLYDNFDPPLGLISLMTYLNRQFGSKIDGKILKSRVDFNRYVELKKILKEFNPDIIGIRTLTMFRDFFHKTIALIRQWGIDVPIITGGPYATSSYEAILQDRNVNLVVLGEGEVTLAELTGKIIENNGKFPGEDVLKGIKGIAFVPDRKKQRFAREIIMLDQMEEIMYTKTKSNPEYNGNPENLAYLIFTSGSTGTPKGVMVEHRNVLTYLNAFSREFKVTAKDIILQQASHSFDIFVEEVFPVLLKGGKIAIPGQSEFPDISLIAEFIRKNLINIISCSPNLLNELNKMDNIAGVHTFISGADVLKGTYINNLARTSNVYNTYGPTETTVCATFYKCPDIVKANIPIGKPIANYRLYVWDFQHNFVPIGVPGELYIAGDGVTRGYLNNPTLTKERFLKSTSGLEERLYKTGDQVRWLLEGNLEFLGRIDHQVKIRGYRIELQEIEIHLLKHMDIREAIVAVKSRGKEDNYLAAYFVSDKKLDNTELREYLLKKLPAYMIPAFFVRLQELPLTPNGKVDRKALPIPEIEVSEKFIEPRNLVEKKITQIWSDILKIEENKISIDSIFFELGGHSLNATALINRLHKEYDVHVPMKEFFETPTIKELSSYIKRTAKTRYASIKPTEKKEYYALSSAQKRLCFFQQMDPESTVYNIPPEVILLAEAPDSKKLKETFIKLIKRHESLRTSFHELRDEPVQRIHEAAEMRFNLEEHGQDVHVEDIIKKFNSPFDLSKAPLLRAALVRTGEGYLMVVGMHHIISDGISQEVLENDFVALYQGKELTPLPIQYKDFAEWQNCEKEKEYIIQQKAYWLKQFEVEAAPLNLPFDFDRPMVQSFEGDSVSFEIPGEYTNTLKTIAMENGATIFMVILAIFNILLSKLSNSQDIVVGTPVAGRRHVDLEMVMGMFVNTLALRNNPEARKTFNQFLVVLRDRTIEAFENQDYQIEDLVARLMPERIAGRYPLTDVGFVFQSINTRREGNPDLTPAPSRYRNNNRISKADLILSGADLEEKLVFSFEYCTKLFKKETIERFIGYFRDIISAVAANKDVKINDISIDYGLAEAKAIHGYGDFTF